MPLVRMTSSGQLVTKSERRVDVEGLAALYTKV
jgi:hypothetical protein